MFPALVFFIAVSLSALNLNCICRVLGEVPTETTICQYPCHLPPPFSPQFPGYPLSGIPPPPPPPPPPRYPIYPSYGAPPPPSSSYPSYGAPPPPGQAQVDCPPAPVQCCQYSPPYPYTFQPDMNHSALPSFSLHSSIMIVISSLAFMFLGY